MEVHAFHALLGAPRFFHRRFALAAFLLLAGCRPASSSLHATCVFTKDCAPGLACVAGNCLPPRCSDGALNGSETDVDCGGPCPPCASGKVCVGSGDCQSRTCAGVCADSQCDDGIMNGSETDLDCGGSCSGCVTTKSCMVGADCMSRACTNGVCVGMGCSDGVKNNTETDLDCGGECARCADGLGCSRPGDCESRVCADATCALPSCTDGVKNGKESDVDCGGGCGKKCESNQGCTVSADCTNGSCIDFVCAHCLSAAECGADSQCRSFSCREGRCGSTTQPEGAVLSDPITGDCHKLTCDADGNEISVVDDLDLPPTEGACKIPTCSSGTPTQTNQSDLTPCATTYGNWGACGGYPTPCAVTGSQSRSITSWWCSSGACVVGSTASETTSCPHPSPPGGNTICEADVCGAYGTCTDFADVCDLSGSEYRWCAHRRCNGAGSCVNSGGTQQARGCSRPTTDGVSCGVELGCGECFGSSGGCSSSGTMTCNRQACSGGTCSSTKTYSKSCNAGNTDCNSCVKTCSGSSEPVCWNDVCSCRLSCP